MIEVLHDRAHNQCSMPKLNHMSVEIDATFGSGFQEEAATKALHKLMQSWTEFYHSKHSNNLIRFRITTVEMTTRARETARG